MAIDPQPITWTGVAILLISNIGIWIDKIKTGRRDKRENAGSDGDLKSIKSTVSQINLKIDQNNEKTGKIETAVAGMTEQIRGMRQTCTETRKAFHERIEDNRKNIFDHLTKNPKKD